MKKISDFLKRNAHFIVVIIAILSCAFFLSIGHLSEDGKYISLDGNDAMIYESTEKIIEDYRDALWRIMNEDAPSQTSVAEDFSGKVVLPVKDRVIRSYTEMEAEFYAFVYSDIDEFFTDDGFYTRMYVKEKENEEITLTVLGDGGTYRLSLYVNNELMPVFDGKSYIDVVTSEENQTDLKIKLDTTELEDACCWSRFKQLQSRNLLV